MTDMYFRNKNRIRKEVQLFLTLEIMTTISKQLGNTMIFRDILVKLATEMFWISPGVETGHKRVHKS